jgi:hypothetical protein
MEGASALPSRGLSWSDQSFPLRRRLSGNMDHPLYGVLPFPDLKSIRLLELDTSVEEGPISCTLTVHSINNTPDYIALSYTWRFPFNIAFPEDKERDKLNPVTKIWCNGKELWVDNNLHAGLVQLRKEKVSQPLWADAICTYIQIRALKLS